MATANDNILEPSIDLGIFFESLGRRLQDLLGLDQPPEFDLSGEGPDGQPPGLDASHRPTQISERGLRTALAAYYLLAQVDPSELRTQQGIIAGSQPDDPDMIVGLLADVAWIMVHGPEAEIDPDEWSSNGPLRERVIAGTALLLLQIYGAAATEAIPETLGNDWRKPQLSLLAIDPSGISPQGRANLALDPHTSAAYEQAVMRIPEDRRILATRAFYRWLLALGPQEPGDAIHLLQLMIDLYSDGN